LRPELAVETGVGAGLALIQAFLAVSQFMFLAADRGVPVLVKAAFISEAHKFILSKTCGGGEGQTLFQAAIAGKGPGPAAPPLLRKKPHPPLKIRISA
jgi:hypothetical protein